jgi:hypothetical protein
VRAEAGVLLKDMVLGTELDSGWSLDVECPACAASHRVSLQNGGRFVFECEDRFFSGIMSLGKIRTKQVH